MNDTPDFDDTDDTFDDTEESLTKDRNRKDI